MGDGRAIDCRLAVCKQGSGDAGKGPSIMSQCVVAHGPAFALSDMASFRGSAHALFDRAHALSPRLVATPAFEWLQAVVAGTEAATAEEQHRLVCAFLDGLKQVSSWPAAPESYSFVAKCAEYDAYIDKMSRQLHASPRDGWASRPITSDDNIAIAQAIDEIVSHVRGFTAQTSIYDNLVAYSHSRMNALIPAEIAGMRQEAHIPL